MWGVMRGDINVPHSKCAAMAADQKETLSSTCMHACLGQLTGKASTGWQQPHATSSPQLLCTSGPAAMLLNHSFVRRTTGAPTAPRVRCGGGRQGAGARARVPAGRATDGQRQEPACLLGTAEGSASAARPKPKGHTTPRCQHAGMRHAPSPFWVCARTNVQGHGTSQLGTRQIRHSARARALGASLPCTQCHSGSERLPATHWKTPSLMASLVYKDPAASYMYCFSQGPSGGLCRHKGKRL